MQNYKKLETKKNNVFHVIAFDPIKIQISWVPQNDHQNLSCVEAINLVGKKLTTNGWKMTNSYLCGFISDMSLELENQSLF